MLFTKINALAGQEPLTSENMFLCCLPAESKEALLRSRHIDRILSKEKQLYKRTQKILLLGSGESGKSTFLKQMKIIHGDGFTAELLLEYQQTIYMNLVKGMKVLVDAGSKLGISLSEPESVEYAQLVYAFNGRELDEMTFLEYADAIKGLWKDQGILRAFERRNEYQLVRNPLRIPLHHMRPSLNIIVFIMPRCNEPFMC